MECNPTVHKKMEWAIEMAFHFWKAIPQILNFMTVFTIAHLKNHAYCALRMLFTSSIVIILPSSFQTLKNIIKSAKEGS